MKKYRKNIADGFRIITEAGLRKFVQQMITGGMDVRGPVATKCGFTFAKIGDPKEIRFDYTRADRSPLAEYLMPKCETILHYTKGDGGPEYSEADTPTNEVVFFGVHPYDIHAANRTDARRMGGQYIDPYYASRRANMTVIGLDVEIPPPSAFCPSMDTHTVAGGFDLMLTRLDEVYLVEVGTSEGGELLEKYALTTPAQESDRDERDWLRQNVSEEYFSYIPVALTDMPRLLEKHTESPFFTQAAELCLACGKCIDVCPTCTCFNVTERPALDGQSGERVREQAICLTSLFRRRTGDVGMETPTKRLRWRLVDKLVGRRGEGPNCIGCGRCTDVCPAKLNGAVLADPVGSVRTVLSMDHKMGEGK